MKHVVRVASLMLLLLAANSPLEAQHAQVRKGFWFSAGMGYGSLGCQDCYGREGGLSGGLALGGTISQRLLLGVGTTGWTKSEDGVTVSAGTLAATARFYTSESGGFFLLGGVGLGTVDVGVAGLGSASETGAGVILGLGYDFRIAPSVSLSPFWNGVGINHSQGDANFGQLGIGVTVH